ncbi:PREDICTED: uncharacterized protein LOC108770863 [Trachymyrmex cornetzi]|uniref:uncharacterized protein LOC108770863 n=1 Tax=Trachymyrmex cornetzi TaxID=471704 RepID=UPI00084F7149|nr:PREDICTED: uncharacterized protein LOC108770863 [Trachymyrmex cornetzi]
MLNIGDLDEGTGRTKIKNKDKDRRLETEKELKKTSCIHSYIPPRVVAAACVSVHLPSSVVHAGRGTGVRGWTYSSPYNASLVIRIVLSDKLDYSADRRGNDDGLKGGTWGCLPLRSTGSVSTVANVHADTFDDCYHASDVVPSTPTDNFVYPAYIRLLGTKVECVFPLSAYTRCTTLFLCTTNCAGIFFLDTSTSSLPSSRVLQVTFLRNIRQPVHYCSLAIANHGSGAMSREHDKLNRTDRHEYIQLYSQM